jgi:peptidoglycan/xylan/chitin deacetylase (PgdA/CDA1 family)
MGKLPTTIHSLRLPLHKHGIRLLIFLPVFVLSACGPALGKPISSASDVPVDSAPTEFVSTETPTTQPTTTETAPPSVTPAATQTKRPMQTLTPTTTFTPTSTPPPLPIFSSRLIRPGNSPTETITDTCTYLQMRWSPFGSPPGTVVIPIMFHGIRENGKPVSDNVTISEEQFQTFVQYAEYLGFQTITSEQLVQFLEHNERIPERSMMMIIDDRRPGTVETYFLPVLEKNNWGATLGWIIGDTDEALWKRMEELAATGLLDVQSHGYLHRYILPEMSEAEVREEITASIPILENHFGKRPIALIWPGGNFTSLAVQVAREAGFRLGFSSSSRGPVMFNWIPLGEEEQAIHDPLMVLPRGWSTALGVNLDWAAQIGDQARQYAVENYPQEAEYYRTYCGGELPPLEEVIPEP